MTLAEAVDLLAGAVPGEDVAWADLGAGTGLFTRALAALLGPGARIVAVDRDASALRQLVADASGAPAHTAQVVAVAGDFRDMESIPALTGAGLDGVLFANALHFVPDPAPVLGQAAARLRPSGRVVVAEYDRRAANPWVPYPLGLERLRAVAQGAGLGPPRVVAERPSAYGGILYCAVLERPRA